MCIPKWEKYDAVNAFAGDSFLGAVRGTVEG